MAVTQGREAASVSKSQPEAQCPPVCSMLACAVQRLFLEPLQRLIATELTDKQRQALVAVRIQGIPLEEVARRMGTNRNALYKLLHDARERLKSRMEADLLKQMARGIMTTRPDEIARDECFKQLDHVVDLVLDGKDAAAAMPVVQDHLTRCKDCREEYEALLAALRAVS